MKQNCTRQNSPAHFSKCFSQVSFIWNNESNNLFKYIFILFVRVIFKVVLVSRCECVRLCDPATNMATCPGWTPPSSNTWWDRFWQNCVSNENLRVSWETCVTPKEILWAKKLDGLRRFASLQNTFFKYKSPHIFVELFIHFFFHKIVTEMCFLQYTTPVKTSIKAFDLSVSFF